MISIPTFMVKEASRIYGDMAEKVAFNVTVDPASVMGALVGGYVANRVQNKLMAGQQQAAFDKMQKEHRIENDYYAQTSNLLANLKIVFTPINVIYSVNGQVFELIGADEMDANMRRAFLQKDAGYFRDLLVNKMNMELQLAQQNFAQRLLEQNGALKESGFVQKQAYLLNADVEEVALMKTAAAELEPIVIPVNFDSLRPFSRAYDFFNDREFKKVAGLFDYFKHDENQEILTMDRLRSEVNVGFLPDRVVYLHNGQLLEQLPLTAMNEAGYEAFRKRDKLFFLDFFNHKASEIAAGIAADAANDTIHEHMDHLAEEETEMLEKESATLEEVVTQLTVNHQMSPVEREHIDWFHDADIHPVLYDKILDDACGGDWYEHELEAIFKQLEVDFHLANGIGDLPFNKIAALYAMMGEESSIFDTSLTFEKFARAMNNKDINFGAFEGNLEFGEIMFALEIAKSYRGIEVFSDFHTLIAEYVSEELYRGDIRMVSTQIYDETNPSEFIFFDTVNGYLQRKWRERDSFGVTDLEVRKVCDRLSVLTADIIENVLTQHADQIDLSHPYESTAALLEREGFLSTISQGHRAPVGNAVVFNVAHHVAVALFLEIKKQELEMLMAKWNEEVKTHGE